MVWFAKVNSEVYYNVGAVLNIEDDTDMVSNILWSHKCLKTKGSVSATVIIV